tara:strand:+ start:1158 stop:1421 length:264 start_codon:yes stop_codon:yes gene_type:complete
MRDNGINYLKYEIDTSSPRHWKDEEFCNLTIRICLHSRTKSASSFSLIFNDGKEELMIGEELNMNQLKRLCIYLNSIFKMDKIGETK